MEKTPGKYVHTCNYDQCDFSVSFSADYPAQILGTDLKILEISTTWLHKVSMSFSSCASLILLSLFDPGLMPDGSQKTMLGQPTLLSCPLLPTQRIPRSPWFSTLRMGRSKRLPPTIVVSLACVMLLVTQDLVVKQQHCHHHKRRRQQQQQHKKSLQEILSVKAPSQLRRMRQLNSVPSKLDVESID